MVGILAQVDDIFSWASRGGKRTAARWVMRIQGHGYLNILCRCTRCCKKFVKRECGFQQDQHYMYEYAVGDVWARTSNGTMGGAARAPFTVTLRPHASAFVLLTAAPPHD